MNDELFAIPNRFCIYIKDVWLDKDVVLDNVLRNESTGIKSAGESLCLDATENTIINVSGYKISLIIYFFYYDFLHRNISKLFSRIFLEKYHHNIHAYQ